MISSQQPFLVSFPFSSLTSCSSSEIRFFDCFSSSFSYELSFLVDSSNLRSSCISLGSSFFNLCIFKGLGFLWNFQTFQFFVSILLISCNASEGFNDMIFAQWFNYFEFFHFFYVAWHSKSFLTVFSTSENFSVLWNSEKVINNATDFINFDSRKLGNFFQWHFSCIQRILEYSSTLAKHNDQVITAGDFDCSFIVKEDSSIQVLKLVIWKQTLLWWLQHLLCQLQLMCFYLRKVTVETVYQYLEKLCFPLNENKQVGKDRC